MFGGGGLCQADLADDIATDAALPFVQHLDNAEPGRMSERLGQPGDCNGVMYRPRRSPRIPGILGFYSGHFIHINR